MICDDRDDRRDISDFTGEGRTCTGGTEQGGRCICLQYLQ